MTLKRVPLKVIRALETLIEEEEQQQQEQQVYNHQLKARPLPKAAKRTKRIPKLATIYQVDETF